VICADNIKGRIVKTHSQMRGRGVIYAPRKTYCSIKHFIFLIVSTCLIDYHVWQSPHGSHVSIKHDMWLRDTHSVWRLKLMTCVASRHSSSVAAWPWRLKSLAYIWLKSLAHIQQQIDIDVPWWTSGSAPTWIILLTYDCHTWWSTGQVDISGNMKKLKTWKCLTE
jgi:hypothetical protein